MPNSSATISRASMLAVVSGLSRSETSMPARPSLGVLGVTGAARLSCWGWAGSCLDGQQVRGSSGRAGGAGRGAAAGGGGGAGGGAAAGGGDVFFDFSSEEAALLSLAESLQAHWHWQDSSCFMMMTGRLRPICCTAFPETTTTTSCERRSWQSVLHSLC